MRVVSERGKVALKIRLARGGARKRPFYRVVVAENTSPRDGCFIERVGHYNPMLDSDNAERIVINVERVKYWLSKGAKATERIALFLSNLGIIEKVPPKVRPKKSAPRKKS
ncbi:MAG: 30S ribosomal protein S16 [Holosporales bacterium]|jgi:small subunit ribosomal protein S16|nr:30S ribosomal protein S16 [Holosporales bacterium]